MAALLDALPALARRLPHAPLGRWPSPLEAASIYGREVWLKREDLSAEGYAGNKIRPLEVVFGAALAAGKRRVWATGAYGSNHALATAVQAPRVGLTAAALLWPQPPSATAQANLVATVSTGAAVEFLPSVAALPLVASLKALADPADLVMPPGAATPLGALGHASAALELAAQAAALGEDPAAIVLPCGSTCTAVGLLVGTELARALGVGFARRLPHLHAVRVTPWPVTSALRIARMAVATARLLAELGGPRLGLTVRAALARLTVDGRYLGAGYGRSTPDGVQAITDLAGVGLLLDPTYSGKAAAYLEDHLGTLPGPAVFWATKSALPLPPSDLAAVARLPRHVRAWLVAA